MPDGCNALQRMDDMFSTLCRPIYVHMDLPNVAANRLRVSANIVRPSPVFKCSESP
jgi:hypothetical protein